MHPTAIHEFLSQGWLLALWLILTALCLAVLFADLVRNNAHLPSLMKFVWVLTVANSGPLGLAVYFYAGRKEIPRDTLPRRSFRSVAHCYSGCGIGEILGVIIAVGMFALGNIWASIITFSLAYLFGFVLTLGPMLQAGAPIGQAVKDTFLSETASIAVMEATAIGIGLWLGGQAHMNEPLFWTSLYVSLSAGLLAAYPVNVLLIHWGIKSGMGSPRKD